MNFYVIAALLAISFVVVNGILMLVVPGRHRRFLAWVGGMGAWSEIFGSAPESGLQIERRLAGLVMAAMGIYMIWVVWKG